mmetsp:Transcript_32713/g.59048  ORF Transcript_32713/g.59048 Transcript_32713/m.59048 type:complete len:81 (+) Transcript_32713:584-826(+)
MTICIKMSNISDMKQYEAMAILFHAISSLPCVNVLMAKHTPAVNGDTINPRRHSCCMQECKNMALNDFSDERQFFPVGLL